MIKFYCIHISACWFTLHLADSFSIHVLSMRNWNYKYFYYIALPYVMYASSLVLNARVLDLNDEQDIVFPATGSPFSTEPQFDFSRAQISIPPSVISESQPAIGEYVLNTPHSISKHTHVSNFYKQRSCE